MSVFLNNGAHPSFSVCSIERGSDGLKGEDRERPRLVSCRRMNCCQNRDHVVLLSQLSRQIPL